MKKDDMLESLELALKYVLTKNLDGIDKHAMELNIKSFVYEEAIKYSSSELIEKFNTPDKTVDFFMEYLEAQGALESNTS